MVNSPTRTCPVCSTESVRHPAHLGGYQLFACPRCTLRFAPDAFHVPVDYDAVYQTPEYDSDQVRALQTTSGKEFANHPTYRSFFSRVRPVTGARLLDVGCGVGRFGQGAHAHGWKVTGIDLSERAIATGRRFASFPLRLGTIEELLKEGEQFDVVTAFEVLEHLALPIQFLSQVRKLLVPGGQVFCTVPNWESDFVRNASRPDWIPPIHLLFFTVPALSFAAKRSGFVSVTTGVIRADPAPAGVVPMARWVARRLMRRPREPLGLWMHGQLPG